MPSILPLYSEVSKSPEPRDVKLTLAVNLNGTTGFVESDIHFGLILHYSKGTLVVDEPVNVTGVAKLRSLKALSEVERVVVGFQNCLASPINPDKEIPEQGYLDFTQTNKFENNSGQEFGGLVSDLEANEEVVWTIDGEYKPIIGIFFKDNTNKTFTSDDVIIHVYPKEQLTNIQVNKVNIELTLAVFILTFLGVCSLMVELWPKKKEPIYEKLCRLMQKNLDQLKRNQNKITKAPKKKKLKK